jgi:hypothetical protein
MLPCCPDRLIYFLQRHFLERPPYRATGCTIGGACNLLSSSSSPSCWSTSRQPGIHHLFLLASAPSSWWPSVRLLLLAIRCPCRPTPAFSWGGAPAVLLHCRAATHHRAQHLPRPPLCLAVVMLPQQPPPLTRGATTPQLAQIHRSETRRHPHHCITPPTPPPTPPPGFYSTTVPPSFPPAPPMANLKSRQSFNSIRGGCALPVLPDGCTEAFFVSWSIFLCLNNGQQMN